MDAEILETAPLSGEYTEVQYNAQGSCLWVKFAEEGMDEWCGVFGKGAMPLSKVLIHRRLKQALIIACGDGYLIDLRTRAVLRVVDDGPFCTAIWPEELDFAILGDWTNVYFIAASGVEWHSRRISLDDLSIESFRKGIVFGYAYGADFEKRPFTIDVSSREIRGAPTVI